MISYLAVFLYLSLADAEFFQLQCEQINNPSMSQKVTLRVYKGSANSSKVFSTSASSWKNIEEDIDPKKPTIVYIHGFTENAEAATIRVITQAYLKKGDVNILIIDWGRVAISPNYAGVVQQVPAVGNTVAQVLKNLADVINLNTVHIIGHSLGAHVAGFAGRLLNQTGTVVPRITGLDVAYPLWYPSACHIKPSDAKVVVALHTNSAYLGTKFSTGTIDFFANKNQQYQQPGCTGLLLIDCSHQRSVWFFAESINHPKAFPSQKCESGTATGPDVVYFGDATPPDARGRYCFETNAKSPFGKGAQ